jgi:hypothetical protein
MYTNLVVTGVAVGHGMSCPYNGDTAGNCR